MTSEDGDILVAEIVDEWRDEKIHIGTPLQPKHAAFGLAAVAVAVTPSIIFNSAAVAVIEVLPI